MTLEEFYAEPRKPAKEVSKPTPSVERGYKPPPDSIYDDEVLPDNVFKAYIAGEIVYMTVSPDGRPIRVDDWFVPGVVG